MPNPIEARCERLITEVLEAAAQGSLVDVGAALPELLNATADLTLCKYMEDGIEQAGASPCLMVDPKTLQREVDNLKCKYT